MHESVCVLCFLRFVRIEMQKKRHTKTFETCLYNIACKQYKLLPPFKEGANDGIVFVLQHGIKLRVK
jgi:hypothetical protein